MDQVEPDKLLPIGFVLAMIVIGVGATLAYLWRDRTLLHAERRMMIEKGLTPPSESGGWPQVKQRETELRFEERRLMIEKGLVPPPEIDEQKRRRDGLHGGVLWLCLGIGLAVTYYLVPGSSGGRGFLAFASPALAMFGLAHIINYWLPGRRQNGVKS